MMLQRGQLLPNSVASSSENSPATSPFTMTMANGSLAEMLRVKLLSIPHKMQASKMPNAPSEKPQLLPGA